MTQDVYVSHVSAPVPPDVRGLQALIHDAAQLSAKHDELRRAWDEERPVAREPGDRRWEWRGWLGFSVLSAYVVGYADPTNPPDEATLQPLREVFADWAVRDVMLGYYSGGAGSNGPSAHLTEVDRQFLNKILGTEHSQPDLPGLLPQNGQPSTWTWGLHRIGTSALVLKATPPDGMGLDPLAIKVIVPPYLKWEEIRRATKESGRLGSLKVDSDALAKSFGSTEAVLITSFVNGPTFAEVLVARDETLRRGADDRADGNRRRARRQTEYSVADGVRFALAYWLPVVRSLAKLDKALSRKDVPKGHGDLNPSNIILREDVDWSPSGDGELWNAIAGDRRRGEALGLLARSQPGARTRIRDRLEELALVGSTLERRRADPGAVFVDLGPSHLLQANPGSGVQSVSHLSRYTAPELLRPGTKRIDRQKADLYSLGDLLLDSLVPVGQEDGERVERVYRYSFELGQLIDSLRSYDHDLRTAVLPPAGHPVSWDELADQAKEILKAAHALGGTGLRAYSFSSIVLRRWSPEADPATRRTGPEHRAATLGAREAWPINWFRASRAVASFVIGTMVLGLFAYAALGCDSFLGSGLCSAGDALDWLPGLLRLDDTSAHRFGVLAVLVSWLFAAHLYYVRMFAQLQPRLCRHLSWRRASEASMRAIAAPLYVLFFVGFVLPETWWFWAGLGAVMAGVNNWLFTQFLGSAVEHLRQHAKGPPSQDSLAAAANRVETFVQREYGRWWLMMVIYGVACFAAGAWLAVADRVLRGENVDAAQFDVAMGLVEWPLIVGAVAVNLTMLYRNCSEMGEKAPEVRANGARAIAGYLRIEAGSGTG